MRRLLGITLLGLFAVAVTVYGQSRATRNPLVGAWRVTEIDDVNRPSITNTQPGLYIFTEQHYSFARINGTVPLPDQMTRQPTLTRSRSLMPFTLIPARTQ